MQLQTPTMQLQNLLPHKRNTTVCVNGHVYRIAQDLIVRDEDGNAVDVPQEDASKLLGNAEAWRAVGATPAPKLAREEAKAGFQVVLSDGTVVAPERHTEDATKPAMEVSAVVAAQDAFEAKKKGELPAPKDPPIPEAGGEWADPLPSYSMEWLQACAKAYKVKYKGKDKTALVQKIKDAMYE